jgi:hypothetical protein
LKDSPANRRLKIFFGSATMEGGANALTKVAKELAISIALGKEAIDATLEVDRYPLAPGFAIAATVFVRFIGRPLVTASRRYAFAAAPTERLNDRGVCVEISRGLGKTLFLKRR